MKIDRVFKKIIILAGVMLLFLTSCGKGRPGGNTHDKSTSSSSPQDESAVRKSDELTSHPRDPDRMAAGVDMEKIVPRLDLLAYEEAVKEFPKVARFHYQLGETLAASGRHENAAKSFEKSTTMGYRMSNYNLGICYADGEGVIQSEKKAKQYLQLAVKAGVEVEQASLPKYVFSSNGFSATRISSRN